MVYTKLQSTPTLETSYPNQINCYEYSDRQPLILVLNHLAHPVDGGGFIKSGDPFPLHDVDKKLALD